MFQTTCTDQPTNLTVIGGTQILWEGTVCSGTETTYKVVITRANDSQPAGDPIETTNTMTRFRDLLPNQEYNVSVSAYGSSCVSTPATVNFTSPHQFVSATTNSKYLSISVVGKYMCMEGGYARFDKNGAISISIHICRVFLGELTRATTDQSSTGQQSMSTNDEHNQSSGTSVGLAVGLTFLFLILSAGVAGFIVAIVVMKKGLTREAKGKLF